MGKRITQDRAYDLLKSSVKLRRSQESSYVANARSKPNCQVKSEKQATLVNCRGEFEMKTIT